MSCREKLEKMLPKYIKANKCAIKLNKDKNFYYKTISSLRLIKFEIFET